jgi:hypothetical protein
MDREQRIKQVQRLIGQSCNYSELSGVYAQVCEFLRVYGGPKNEFLEGIKQYNPRDNTDEAASTQIRSILTSYLQYLQEGLADGISPERKAQQDVVSDFLGMANTLLETANVHPAAPAVLIGASLEEFLRTWVETDGLSLGNRKPSLDTYSQVLRETDLITKQDGKDITAWAGVRNYAAHGEWKEVEDKARIKVMLEGVNLFMRKYSK